MMKASRHIFELLPLTLPFQLSMLHGILCHLPDKAFFELEEAPCLACRPRPVHTSEQAEDRPKRTVRLSAPRARSPWSLASTPGATCSSALFWSVPHPIVEGIY